MQELRLVAVSEDGTYLVLATAGRGTRFTLPVDDRLRAAVRGHFSRLGQFEIEVESPLRPKEIQARIRAGETAEEIAESAGIPVERVRWFEGPVLQEREYMAQQAQRVPVRRPGESAPGPPLGETVEEKLNRGGVDLEDVEWDSWKCEDSTWRVRLSFFDDGRPHAAEWLFDPRRRHLSPLDQVAARLSGQEWAGGGGEGTDTVTPLLPRRPPMKIVQDARDLALAPGPRPAPPPPPPYVAEGGRLGEPPAPLAPAPSPSPAAPGEVAEPVAFSSGPTAFPPGPAAPGSDDLVRDAEVPDVSAPMPGQSRPAAKAPEPDADAAPEIDTPAPEAGTGTSDKADAEHAAAAAPRADATPDQANSEPAPAPARAEQPEPPELPELPAENAAPPPEAPPTSKPAPPKPRPPRREKAPAARPAPAAAAETPVAEPAPRDVPAPPAPPAAPAAQQRQPAASRRRKAKGKRASVPSWDEIMFGARRPD